MHACNNEINYLSQVLGVLHTTHVHSAGLDNINLKNVNTNLLQLICLNLCLFNVQCLFTCFDCSLAGRSRHNLTIGWMKVPVFVCTVTTRIRLSGPGWIFVTRPRGHWQEAVRLSLMRTISFT